MSKKKKNKKHKFKHAPSIVATAQSTETIVSTSGSAAIQTLSTGQKPLGNRRNSVDVLNLAHVTSDIRKVAVLAVGFILLQVVLWYLFEHTPLGVDVYSLYKL